MARFAAISFPILLIVSGVALAQPAGDADRIAALEVELAAARQALASLSTTVDALAVEVETLKGTTADTTRAAGGDVGGNAGSDVNVEADVDTGADTESNSYAARILVPDLGDDERDTALTPRPELFVQTRYHANPIDEATEDDVVRNFGLSRAELRWSGHLAERIGMGFEAQFHPAPDGAPEELVNDAFVEYYANDAVTVRAGQFVKPFGFDIQHSSSHREAPERGIFAGYFFPGQRDRGVMLSANLDRTVEWASGVTVYAALLNGNRFFDDNNSDVNANLRIRKIFPSRPLALGVSLQRGTQILPPGMTGDDDENLYGVDIQYVIGRFGIRAEYVRGNMPSTLLALEPEFAPGFTPGAESEGAAAFFNYRLSSKDDIYWRVDRFENDPVTNRDIRAVNVGYLRTLGPNSRIGIDYQSKDGVSFNDDELNNAFTISWNVSY
jgi:hypothetical protein